MLDKPANGFLLGKFMPPHKGHVFLCEFARNYCEHLTILVASLPDEPIPGKLRYEWMKRMFDDGGETCTVIWTDEVLPQEPRDDNDTEFWATWKRVVEEAQLEVSHRIYDEGGYEMMKMPDVVFASEDYGHRLAAEVGARFVPCDMVRQTVPTSGTKVRFNPQAEWDFLPDIVKPYFVKRVTLFGPESTGKSTLAAQLGKHFRTVVVPEYGRTYTETFGSDVGDIDLRRIVAGHLASVKAAKPMANRVLIEDTDPVMSAVWSDMLTGDRDPWFADYNDYPDLYLLCDVDIPWVDDGTRYFKNDEDRRRFFETCEAELKRRGVPYVVIRGDHHKRFRMAEMAVEALIR